MRTVIEEGRGSGLRGSLSREEILAAGLRIARRSDLSSINMRELARELGVTPMAIYHHFESKRALIEGIIDRYVTETAVTQHEVAKSDWRAWLKRTFMNIYRSWEDAPGVQALLGSIADFGPGLMRPVEETLEVLVKAGLPKAEAVRVFSALMGLTMGRAILQAMKMPMSEFAQRKAEWKSRMDRAAAQYPYFTAVFKEIKPQQFNSIEFELDLILDSVERLIAQAKTAR